MIQEAEYMKKSGRILSLVLSMVMMLSLCGCDAQQIAKGLEDTVNSIDELEKSLTEASNNREAGNDGAVSEPAVDETEGEIDDLKGQDDNMQEKSSPLSEDRLETIATIKKISNFEKLNLYSMEICYDYDFDNLLSPAGVYDEKDVVSRILNEALPGVEVDITMPDFGCSAFTLEAADGNVYMGRNYDFKFDTSAMQVYCHPKDGYASVSYCALDNLGVEDPFESEEKMATCLAAPFTCLDGMNEKGVAIAVLTLPSTPTKQDTGKPVITTSATIRLVLDKAASTQEAIDLISQYDMFATSGRDYHFYITDATGDGRIVEYDPEQEDRPMVVTPIRSITNYFGMYEDRVIAGQKNGRFGQGKERKERIESAIARDGDNTDMQTVWAGLKSASTVPNPESIISNTQWSIEYNLTELKHEFALHRRWADTFAFEKLNVPVEKESELSQERLDSLDTFDKLLSSEGFETYSVEIKYDYDIKNVSSSEKVSEQQLLKLILAECAPGYTVEEKELASDTKQNSSVLLAHCNPWDGYVSVAAVPFDFSGTDKNDLSDENKMECLCSPLLCMEGINEKGVGIAALSEGNELVSESGEKPALAAPILIRLVLDKASTTQEALELLEDSDIKIAEDCEYHFFITDKSNDSCEVSLASDKEKREMVVKPSDRIKDFSEYMEKYYDKNEK